MAGDIGVDELPELRQLFLGVGKEESLYMGSFPVSSFGSLFRTIRMAPFEAVGTLHYSYGTF